MATDAAAVPLTNMFGAPLAQEDQEATLFSDSLAGPQLGEGWRWVREDAAEWTFGDESGKLVMKPGGLWGRVFAESQWPPLLLRPLKEANACEVTVTMPPAKGDRGEQAGLFWYADDNNYAKLVVEWTKDGSAKIVLARERAGEAQVCGTADLDDDAAFEPVRLRLELSADGSELSGVIVGAYYSRFVGSCPANADTWGGSTVNERSVGISAHGGTAARAARFSKFAAIAVRPNRVQWNSSGGVPAIPAFAMEAAAVPTPQQAGYAPPPPGAGLTLSPSLSEEERNKVAALLMGCGGSPPADL